MGKPSGHPRPCGVVESGMDSLLVGHLGFGELITITTLGLGKPMLKSNSCSDTFRVVMSDDPDLFRQVLAY